MSMYNQEEYSFFELKLFKRPFVQSHIRNEKFDKIYLITKLENSGLIEFVIKKRDRSFSGLETKLPEH